MNYRKLMGTSINVDGEQMRVTDYCRMCRMVWADGNHYQYIVKVKSNDEMYIKDKKLKPL